MGSIVVFGPRWSGKTTYLAGLAYWPSMGNQNGNSILVEPINQDAKKLVNYTKNQILQQESVKATKLGETKELIYLFNINVKPRFGQAEQINLVAKDYAGEIWSNIEDAGEIIVQDQDFFEEALLKEVQGWLIMLPGWEWEYDDSYHQVMKILIELMDSKERLNDLRLAVTMSKCERGEIWPGRIDPEIDLFKKELKRTYSLLKEKINPQNLRFYASSTFGVLARNDPRPNRLFEAGNKDKAVLRDMRKWQPYNMIAPLYWLNTGKRFWDDI